MQEESNENQTVSDEKTKTASTKTLIYLALPFLGLCIWYALNMYVTQGGVAAEQEGFQSRVLSKVKVEDPGATDVACSARLGKIALAKGDKHICTVTSDGTTYDVNVTIDSVSTREKHRTRINRPSRTTLELSGYEISVSR